MTPKKAIIIVLIMFLTMALVFVFLYLNNQSAVEPAADLPADNTVNSAPPVTQEQKIEEIQVKTNQKIEEIVEQGKTETGGITKEAAEDLEAVINQAITAEANLKTPEQIEADRLKELEREKMEQLLNQQMKN